MCAKHLASTVLRSAPLILTGACPQRNPGPKLKPPARKSFFKKMGQKIIPGPIKDMFANSSKLFHRRIYRLGWLLSLPATSSLPCRWLLNPRSALSIRSPGIPNFAKCRPLQGSWQRNRSFNGPRTQRIGSTRRAAMFSLIEFFRKSGCADLSASAPFIESGMNILCKPFSREFLADSSFLCFATNE